MKILYLPIYEPGSYHERATANKHGLRTALQNWGEVVEFDYLKPSQQDMYSILAGMLVQFKPDILFTQLQGSDRITGEDLRAIRLAVPNMKIVNWNGDYWPRSLTTPDMLALLKHVDLQLVVNGSVLDTYREHDINAALWPHSFETPVRELPDVPEYDVLYLGNNYSEKRKELYTVLRSLPYKVGIYGNGWEQSEGECTYDFTTGHALYSKARICISDNEYTDAVGYLSNRPFQAMAAGCFVLQQYVPELEERVGFCANVHYGEFTDIADIPAMVDYYMAHDYERNLIARAGQAHTLNAHSFDARVKQLFTELLPEVVNV